MRLASFLCLLFALSLPAAAQVDVTVFGCDIGDGSQPTGTVAWPADDPVWTFDYYRPANNTTAAGTGLEIRDVRYNDQLVFRRAGVPVLNVEYDEGTGCSCFRDWQYEEAPFQTDGVQSGTSCLALSTPGVVQSTCEVAEDNGGGDVGSFEGVAFEDYGSELVLTSHMRAGWYRYRMRWHFYDDGRIWPEYSYAAASATCTEAAHRHHAYWRFDFDLEGTAENDLVMEFSNTNTEGTLFTSEADRTWGEAEDDVFWSVRDAETTFGYEIIPSEADLQLPVDGFSQTDALIVKYADDEIDDSILHGGGCAFDYSNIMDDESIDGEDVVFWYRSSALHTEGKPWECDIVGPSLTPIGLPISNEDSPERGGFTLESAYPNPFSPRTTVRFHVDETQQVDLILYDIAGRELRTVFSGTVVGGRTETAHVDGSDLPAGTYIVRLIGETVSGSTRVMLVR